MNLTLWAGIVAIVLGIVILVWPVLLSVIVGLLLIAGGAFAIYAGLTGRQLA